MRPLLTALFVLTLAAPVWADDKLKPNTLTPKEIAEGWILLFDGETKFNWRPKEDVHKLINVEKGELLLGGDHMLATAPPRIDLYNYEVFFDYRVVKGNDRKSFILYFDAVYSNPDLWSVQLPIPDRDEEWRNVHVTFHSDKVTKWAASLSFKDKKLKNWEGTLPFREHGLAFKIREGVQVALRNVKLKPLGMKPIFNCKDLTGWKKFESDPKRAKSQFSVTKEGWMSIKNGPGDLQTTGEWSDFVLQLDCRTNGDNLNSGVFFRCIPGQYQNGYEAQIQNQKAKEPKKYTIEEYDPRTHELKGKKKIENWSQDYGTGAIYRRVPARRSVAKDGEWFTMTLIARGRHIATWVNGIQVTDWTDNRPENDNARNGCRLKKGPLSLQGHDPTTDLTFRNIRLADLAEKE
jgi:hypothetical protein